mmetsp:Transcript_33883/g.77737  ORF Transcript_33883/g.77737 Transcript_33883/m.77737 type:complete len:209 (-) Transcript_33883:93-719(-)
MQKKPQAVPVLLRVLVSKNCFKLAVDQVHVGGFLGPRRRHWVRRNRQAHLLQHASSHLRDPHAVAVPPDAALSEFHSVPGERPGLVGENILNLAQLLVEVRGPHRRLGPAAAHVLVCPNEETLQQLDHAQRDDQGDGDKIAENNQKCEKFGHAVQEELGSGALLHPEVLLPHGVATLVDSPSHSSTQAQDHLNSQDNKHQLIGQLLQG